MSPVFRHGGLRLYLLKLLNEAPRHGYDVIRLLQDKFLGVYSPSPGTIYPRLARLEEEGLVTHETVDGKKIYKITDAGRAELNRRLDDLADLEDELAASVRDIAKEISRDVRETVRNLRDELTWAVREAGRNGTAGPRADSASGAQADTASGSRADAASGSRADSRPEEPGGRDDGVSADAETGATADAGAWSEATSAADAGAAAAADAGRADAGRADAGRAGGGRADAEATADPGEETGEQRQRRHNDWRADWRDWAERTDWRDWADWAKHQGWADWTGKQDWRERAKAGRSDWAQWTQANRPDWLRGAGPRDRHEAHADLVSDLEHLATLFAKEIRGVARHAENMGDDTVGSLGRILGDALNRIRTEVFRAPEEAQASAADQADPDAADASDAPDAPDADSPK